MADNQSTMDIKGKSNPWNQPRQSPHIRMTKMLNTNSAVTMPIDRQYMSSQQLDSMGSSGETVKRTFTLYGSMRPQPAFTNATRNEYFAFETAMDMSNKPAPWSDVDEGQRKDNSKPNPSAAEKALSFTTSCPNAGSFQYKDFGKVDIENFKLLENQNLMTPSERRIEANKIKHCRHEFERAKKANAEASKQRRVVAAHYSKGLTGVDGPCYPETKYWKEDRERNLHADAYVQQHSDRRRDFLKNKNKADLAFFELDVNGYTPPKRCADIPIQRNRIDVGNAPNTHTRIFPKETVHQWDPVRAHVMYHHGERGKNWRIWAPSCSNELPELKVRENVDVKMVGMGSNAEA